MTDQGYRHITLVVDRSLSMTGCRADTEAGIRQFITGQRNIPGRTTVSLWQFDTSIDEVHAMADISDPALLGFELVPRGSTALLDATGFAISALGADLRALPDDQRPGTVIMVVATDGQENASREYGPAQVRDMITRQQEKYGWVFYFIGADQDAFTAGHAMGYTAGTTMTTTSVSLGTALAATSGAVTRGSSGGTYDYSTAERFAAMTPDS